NPDCSLQSGLSPEDTAGIPLTKGYPFENNIYGDTQSNVYNAFYNAGYNITDGVQFYSFGSFSHRKASAYENYRAPSKVTRFDNSETLVVPFPLGFSPREQVVENDFSVTGGLKGTAAGWDWDLSTTYGRDKNDISTINTANRSLFQDTGFTPTNIYDGAWTATQWTNNLDIDHSFDVGLATPLNFALGGEIRKDTYGIT
ncbi:MAG: TonB-dependent receptor plug domain-containing protein, partial [Gammaproteobacteria bacterium]